MGNRLRCCFIVEVRLTTHSTGAELACISSRDLALVQMFPARLIRALCCAGRSFIFYESTLTIF
jgi:hypothetical protein